MRKHTHTKLRIAWLAAVPLLLLALDHPDFTGKWKLNAARSDDAQAKMQEATGGQGRPAGGPGQANAARRGRMMRAAESMEISQDGNTLKIRYAGGRTVTLTADGSAQEQETRRGTMTTTTSWEGNKLVSVRDMGRMKITTSYVLSADGKQLIVTRRFESKRFSKPVEIRSVYDKTG